MSAITVMSPASASIVLSRPKRICEVIASSGLAAAAGANGFDRRGTGVRLTLEPALDQAADEVVEPDVLVVVMADPQVLAGRVDAPRRVELGGEDPQVDVGQEAAQHQQAVGRLHQLGDLGAAHRPLVDAGEQRVGLRDHALAQDRRGDGHPRRLGQPQQLVLQAEAVDLDVGQDHRPLRGREQGDGLVERLAQGLGVAGRQPLRRADAA